MRDDRASARDLWTLAVIALCAALALPTPVLPALGPRYGGELHVVVADTPPSSEPAVPQTAAQRLFAALAHETLVGVDEEGRPLPSLARSWSSAAGGREWTLRLGESGFHDGGVVKAEDAARALRRFLRSGSSAAAHLAGGLDGGEAFRRDARDALPGLVVAGDSTLVLRWSEPPAWPLAPLASPAAAVVSLRGAGAGPFVPTTPPSALGVSATAFGAHVRGRPLLDVVRLSVRPAPDRTWERGADVGPGLPPPEGASGLLLLVLDRRAPPFDDARVRALAAAAVDRAQLVRHFLPGGAATDGLLVPPLLAPWPAAPEVEPPSAPARLRGRVVLRVSSEVPPTASRRVVAHLSALGLDVQAAAVPAPLAAEAAGARLLVWYPEVAEAGLALEELAAMAGPTPEASAALAKAERERNADRRREWLRRAEEALRATHVLVPLARMPLPLGVRPGVHRIVATASGAIVLEHAWIEP